MNHFNKDNALELLDGDEELLEILLDAFLETEFSEEKLYGFIDSRSYAEGASYVHKVKGAARQLAMEKLKNIGQVLEDFFGGKNTECGKDIKELAAEFADEYKESFREVKMFLSAKN